MRILVTGFDPFDRAPGGWPVRGHPERIAINIGDGRIADNDGA